MGGKKNKNENENENLAAEVGWDAVCVCVRGKKFGERENFIYNKV